MDFYTIKEREGKKGVLEVYPDFKVTRSKDLMVYDKIFKAIWDEKVNLWNTDEYRVAQLIDEELEKHEIYTPGLFPEVYRRYLGNFSSSTWLQFLNYVNHLTANAQELDSNLTFSNTEVTKEDYVSRRLPYALEEGDYSAFDELLGVLYAPEERAKLEWAIGAIIAGDAKHIQKFIVMYGPGGTGKSTVLQIIQMLFEGYIAFFEAKALTNNNNQFSTAAFKNNPLVAIQHDGDLSKIEDNSKLNSIVAHEDMWINEKYKAGYWARVNAFLFMGTNKPVKISDAKSGIIRRLIDVQPTGNRVSPKHYQALMSQIKFELGAIAHHCLQVYLEMGKNYYEAYRPVEMMLQTDVFYNFIEAYFDVFKAQNGTTLKQAFDLYKKFCDDALIEYKMPQYKFREELKNYFDNFEERAEIDNVRVRSWFSGFNADRFKFQIKEDEQAFSLVMDETESLLDKKLAKKPAQYAKADGSPERFWTDKPRTRTNPKTGKIEDFTPRPDQVVSTILSDLDTSKEHYVKVSANHIVIDFDLTDEEGNKSAERNLEAASQWPPTYAEYSKSGEGVHLHYNYDGDVSLLRRIFEEGIEVKVYAGDSALRRRLTRCNNVPIATINSGLPLREPKVMNETQVKTEKGLRDIINRNLRKEIHPGTKSSIDFIVKILDDAYLQGLTYDVTDMRQRILAFASNSTHNAMYCMKQVQNMKFKTESVEEEPTSSTSDDLYVFDVEVFPNLFIVCYKRVGSPEVITLINPSPQQMEELMGLKLIGYNCRRYDNHIVYGRYQGMDNQALYELSQKIINSTGNGFFGAAYNLSYADIYDFSSLKQGLKAFQIDLDIPHKELGLPWDQPVPKEKWELVAQYCANDVETTEQVLEARKEDFIARQILADLSGLPVNATTQQHASKIVFGDDRKPQEKFVYTDLRELFPGYEFNMGKSTYQGEDPSEGGYVYAEPGIYENVAVLDVASMHPTSIEQLNLFGEYTANFSALKEARIAIKRKDYAEARGLLGGILAKYLGDEEESEALAYALKIVINIVYGLTAARFENSFRDPRNLDNIVAKRGALFMIDLKNHVQAGGYQVAHIKTDSIKIPNATKEIIDEIMEFGRQYGYEFEHEATYDKFALVNDAVYIAKVRAGRKPEHWEAVGAQFAHPYVFKTLFTKEKIQFKDLCEAKNVNSVMYLDFTDFEKPMVDVEIKDLHFIGKAGLFCPIQPGQGGGKLVRVVDGKQFAVTGTTGYQWLEADMVKTLGLEKLIDMEYFKKLANNAVEKINAFGSFEEFAA